MNLREDDLVVQVECPIDFVALVRHGVDVSNYILTQGFEGYFGMLNGPTYENLVKDFWVRAKVYDKKDAKLEEFQKIEEDETLKGKTREHMGFPEFTRTEIHSAVMGIPITIIEEIIARAARCSNEGKFQWNLWKKSSWVQTIAEVLHKNRPTDKYCDM